jgi:hypothetical protein
MAWIKRNLLFVIGGAVALLLLGAGGFYIFKSSSDYTSASTKLDAIYDKLKDLQGRAPAPGNDKVNNTELAREQNAVVAKWIVTARNYFQPVPAIPQGTVTDEAFASALRRTVEQLQRAAENAGVTLPPKYDFSFTAQRPLVKFSAESLEPLAVQLGEVKVLAEAVFSAKVNALDSIQRVRVSNVDMTGPVGDYIDLQAVTNEMAVVTPYVVTFRSFTPELSRLLSVLAGSSNALVIKAINIQPANMATTGGVPGATPGMPYPGAMPGMMPGMRIPGEFEMQPQPAATPGYQPATTTARGGLQTVLKEQLLRVTMEVGFIKLLPKS